MFLFPLLFAGCANSNIENTKAVDTLSTASAMVGLHEVKNRKELKVLMGVDPVQNQWCAAFVNSILKFNGIPGSEVVSSYPLTARSFIYWGEYAQTPELGDIIVFPRGNQGWQGHVGFYIETIQRDGIDQYVILGGNQNNEVSYDFYPASKAIAIRRWNQNPQ